MSHLPNHIRRRNAGGRSIARRLGKGRVRRGGRCAAPQPWFSQPHELVQLVVLDDVLQLVVLVEPSSAVPSAPT
jgi:hypothetical protein